jgi:hypothetical protein
MQGEKNIKMSLSWAYRADKFGGGSKTFGTNTTSYMLVQQIIPNILTLHMDNDNPFPFWVNK